MSLALIAVFLTSCASRPGQFSDPHTGQQGVYSARYSADSGLFHDLNVKVGYSNKVGYAIGTEFLLTGGSWSFFREAWSGGQQFPYVVISEKVLGCTAGCTFSENGAIRLSEREFIKAATNGFAFKLIGKNNSIVGTVPAAPFIEVLELLRASGIGSATQSAPQSNVPALAAPSNVTAPPVVPNLG